MLDESIDEPGKHTHAGDQSEDLKDPKEDKEHCEKHLGGLEQLMQLYLDNIARQSQMIRWGWLNALKERGAEREMTCAGDLYDA